ncbi:uncharacterized protein ACMZJ9_022393 isoform 1-T3 [Mantella aurantiaca]
MCLKYNLQAIPDCELCDGSSRQRAMAAAHHTFLIDCDTGVCICLSGDPTTGQSPASTQAARTPMARSLLKTCLTDCVKEQQMGAGRRQPPARPGESCAKRKIPSLPRPKRGDKSGPRRADRTGPIPAGLSEEMSMEAGILRAPTLTAHSLAPIKEAPRP